MNIFYLKWSFPFPYWLHDNIFYLKMVCRPILFWEFGKIIPISSIWKRDFFFLDLWWEPLENNTNIFSLKTGFPLFFFGLWWQPLENNINIFYLKTEFPCFFWACDGNLIWKRDFRAVSFWAFLENNASIFYLKTGFSFFGLVMATSGK